jgi:hypothetical protein
MKRLNRYEKIGKYEISEICLQSYPCQHYIKFNDGEIKTMRADNIYRLFKSEGLSYPHIDEYAEYVRQRDFPTPEEIKKRKDDFREASEKRAKENEIRAKEEAEQQKTIDQYKASSRIDKLKNKNNIVK